MIWWIVLLIISGYNPLFSQSSGYFRPFGEMDTKFEEPKIDTEDVLDIEEFIPLENPLVPDKYILGPGDVLGINIITTQNLLFRSQVNPTGDILIPTVGIVNVAGLTLSHSIELIRNYIIENVYLNSVVVVSLVNIRSFRLLIVGAIQHPGFVTVTPIDRLTDAISLANGLHKYADEEKIKIIRSNGASETISIKSFLLQGNLKNNPSFREGDQIEVPFLDNFQPQAESFTTFNESAILITGFVKRPGAFRYFPGYPVRDYIAMAGGVLETGTNKKFILYRNNEKFKLGFGDLVKPGDQIIVQENIKSKLLGNVSFVQALSSLLTIYLTYRAVKPSG